MHRKSGHYDVTVTMAAAPEFRWPSEGFISTSLGKKPFYDDITLAQLVLGQLNNMPKWKMLEVLNQVALTVRDAVSIL